MIAKLVGLPNKTLYPMHGRTDPVLQGGTLKRATGLLYVGKLSFNCSSPIRKNRIPPSLCSFMFLIAVASITPGEIGDETC